jgi:hypothetical protein
MRKLRGSSDAATSPAPEVAAAMNAVDGWILKRGSPLEKIEAPRKVSALRVEFRQVNAPIRRRRRWGAVIQEIEDRRGR